MMLRMYGRQCFQRRTSWLDTFEKTATDLLKFNLVPDSAIEESEQ